MSMKTPLDHHLAKGYDYYQHGRRKPWTPQQFAEHLEKDPDLLKLAKQKLAELAAVKRNQRQCHVSEMQHRVLADALALHAKQKAVAAVAEPAAKTTTP